MCSNEFWENMYGNEVLVGNWFEERFAVTSDPKAIVPAINGESGCLIGQTSTHRSDFGQILKKAEIIDRYMNSKIDGYSNRQNGETSLLNLWDGIEFQRNFATTKDITYRIKPAEALKAPKVEILQPQKKDEDLMKSFDNATHIGLRDNYKCDELREARRAHILTSQQRDYPPKLHLLKKYEFPGLGIPNTSEKK